jgi:tetratricopeptide (TPR) repeat protein
MKQPTKFTKPQDYNRRILSELGDIRKLLSPKTSKTWYERTYDRAAMLAKYIGIPGLILAAVGPLQKISSDLVEYENRALIQRVYIDYASALLAKGSIERANKLLTTLETQKDFDARLQFYKAKTLIAMAIQQGRNYTEALDTASILTRIADEKSILFPSLGSTDDIVQLNLSIADIYIAQQKYAEAVEKIEQLRSNKMFARSVNFTAEIQYRIGTVDVLQYKLASAKELLLSCIEESDKSGQKLLAANATFELAKAYQFGSDLDQALKLYDQSISRYQALQEKFGILRAYNNMAMIYFDRAENSKARLFYNKEQVLAREVGDELGYARATVNLGGIEKREGNYTGSVRYGLEALGVFRQQGDVLGVNTASNLLANSYSLLGKYSDALAYAKENLSSSLQLRELRGVAAACGTLSNIYFNIDDTTELLFSSLCASSLIKHLAMSKLPYAGEDYDIFINRMANIFRSNRDAYNKFNEILNRVRDIFITLNLNLEQLELVKEVVIKQGQSAPGPE